MMRTFLLLWLVVQLSFLGIEGDYQVLVSVHSLVLLESRCAECYGETIGTIKRNACCDGDDESPCPASCDILLRFCQLGDLSLFNLADRSVGTKCVQSPLSSYFEDWLGYNLMAGETYPEFDEENLLGGIIFKTRVAYDGAGRWEGAQLDISVVDRDTEPDDFADLIDYFSVPINISAGSSVTSNFTGIYNYVQLELTIKVRCTARNNTDENCGCLPGFTGQLCEDIDDCIGVTCSDKGRCVDEDNGYQCVCLPGFSGALCEVNIDDCIGVKCSNRGKCVDGVQNFSCNCEPGYTGAICESEMASSISTASNSAPAVPVPAITGGVIGGVLFLLMLVILLLVLALLVSRWRRTKIFDVQGSSKNSFDSSKVVLQSRDVQMYDEDECKSGSETLKEFNNPIYGDDPELKHEYETTDKSHSGSKDHSASDEYQELERKFENPIYGDEDDDNLSNPIPVHESNTDYDQVGNVYHTLESEQDRQQRYTEAGQTTSAAVASVEVKTSSKGQTGKPQHSYEDVQ